MPTRLAKAFYERPTLTVAAELIGKVLVHRTRAGVAAGMIVEVEAYIGEDDPACHAAPGPTARNAPLYGAPGHAYVYLNYGIHYLVNVVTEPEGSPAAVLIRALEPLDGIALMTRRRGGSEAPPLRGRRGGPDEPRLRSRRAPADHAHLCRGPGNLTEALGITLKQNRADLSESSLVIEDRGLDAGTVSWGPRIGIRVGVDRRWRCAVDRHPAVSRGK